MKTEDAGQVLADILRNFLYDLEVEDGLSEIGYRKEDIPELVKGTIPQVCPCLPFFFQVILAMSCKMAWFSSAF